MTEFTTDRHQMACMIINASSDVDTMREWMHGGEYEGTKDCLFDGTITNQQWVDSLSLSDLQGYLCDKVKERDDFDEVLEIMEDLIRKLDNTPDKTGFMYTPSEPIEPIKLQGFDDVYLVTETIYRTYRVTAESEQAAKDKAFEMAGTEAENYTEVSGDWTVDKASDWE